MKVAKGKSIIVNGVVYSDGAEIPAEEFKKLKAEQIERFEKFGAVEVEKRPVKPEPKPQQSKKVSK